MKIAALIAILLVVCDSKKARRENKKVRTHSLRERLGDIHLESDLSFMQDQYFPSNLIGEVDTSNFAVVQVCKLDKIETAANIAKRPFDRATSECKHVTFDDFSAYVKEHCPMPKLSFIHHTPHSGSTLLSSMLESAGPSVRTWSEYTLVNQLKWSELSEGRSNERAKTLIQGLACSKPDQPKIDHMIMKLSSAGSKTGFDFFRDRFSESPWLFLYRKPVEVVYRLCRNLLEIKDANDSPCKVSGKNATLEFVEVYLKSLMDRANKNAMSAMFDKQYTPLFVNYDNLLGNIEGIMGHFGINIDKEALAEVMEVAKYDPKKSRALGRLVEYQEKKLDVERLFSEHPKFRAAVTRLERMYEEVENTAREADHLHPAEMPELFELETIFRAWNPSDSRVPQDHRHNSLQVFSDFKTQLREIKRFQASEVPFIVSQERHVNHIKEGLNKEFLLKNVRNLKMEQSNNTRHMHYFARDFEPRFFPNRTTPTEPFAKTKFQKFLGAVSQQIQKPVKERSTVYGTIRQEQNPWLRRLDQLLPKLNWADDHTPWQCKLGMPGIRNEAHFDRSRNTIVMLAGVKRWIIIPPAHVSKLGLHTSGPYYRHASFDWADEQNWKNFDDVYGVDVVLRPGDVLYLPIGWTHYVLSTDEVSDGGYNFQCNSWSGKSTRAQPSSELAGFSYRADKALCASINNECKYLTENCMKGKCEQPHVAYGCYSRAYESAKEKTNDLVCPEVDSRITYYGALCHVFRTYDPKTCPIIAPNIVTNLTKILSSAAVEDKPRRKLLLGVNSSCDGDLRDVTVNGYENNAAITETIWSQSSSPAVPSCNSGLSFSNMFVDNASYGYNRTYYTCEIKPACTKFTWINDLSRAYGWVYELQYMSAESDDSGFSNKVSIAANGENFFDGWFDMDYDGDDYDVGYKHGPMGPMACPYCMYHEYNASYSKPLLPINPRLYGGGRPLEEFLVDWTDFDHDGMPSVDADFCFSMDLDESERVEARLYGHIPDEQTWTALGNDFEDGMPDYTGTSKTASPTLSGATGGFMGPFSLVNPFIFPQHKDGYSVIQFEFDYDDVDLGMFRLNVELLTTWAPTITTASPTLAPTTATPTTSTAPSTAPSTASRPPTRSKKGGFCG